MTLAPDDYPRRDDEVAPFVAALGLPGIVDIHVHALPARLQRAVWRFFDGLHDPPWPIAYRLDQQAQLAVLRDLGVVRHTALAYAHRPGMLTWLNDHTLALAEQHPQVVPTFTIYPEPGVGEATEAAIARGGQVVKVHLQVGRHHPDDPRLDAAWRAVAAARLPVVLHASAVYGVDGGDSYCGAAGVARLLERHPDLRLVIAHLGMPQHEEFLALAEAHPDVHLDCSMTLCDSADAVFDDLLTPSVRERLHALLPRLLFGSDYPSIPHAYATQVRALGRLGLDEAELRGVLHDHALALLPG